MDPDNPYLTSDDEEDTTTTTAATMSTSTASSQQQQRPQRAAREGGTAAGGGGGVRKRVRTRETISLVRGRSSSRPATASSSSSSSASASSIYNNSPFTKTHLRTRSDTSCMMTSDLVASAGADGGCVVRSRDLSPSEVVRAYLARADESIDHVIERLVTGMQEQAAAKSTALVEAGSKVAHRLADQADVLAEKSAAVVSTAVAKLTERWKACHFGSLPDWMKDNEHLHFGHRPELQSAAECFKSIFRIHTETGNIWTHMIGFFAFLVVTIVFYVKPFCDNCREDIGPNEKLIFLCFFVGAMVCLLCSTLFHTMSAHSEWVSNLFSRLDYVGIAVLIVGSSLTWLYYGFYCEFYTKAAYMVAVSVMGAATAVVTMSDRFNTPDYRPYRALLFVSLGLVSALPVIHFVFLYGLRLSWNLGALPHMLSMGGLYILGATLYALRIPERWLPGKCDIWFQSHQLFHVLVIVAAFVHYHGVYEMARLRLQSTDAFCPVQPTGVAAAV